MQKVFCLFFVCFLFVFCFCFLIERDGSRQPSLTQSARDGHTQHSGYEWSRPRPTATVALTRVGGEVAASPPPPPPPPPLRKRESWHPTTSLAQTRVGGDVGEASEPTHGMPERNRQPRERATSPGRIPPTTPASPKQTRRVRVTHHPPPPPL